MRPRQTGVRIVSGSRASGVVTTELLLEEGAWPAEPVAPATVWTEKVKPTSKLIELHRLVKLGGETAIFESYGTERVPKPGGLYSLFAWFTPEQFDVLNNRQLRWERRRFDGPLDEHCLLTWRNINPGEEAYTSDAGWITADAYDRLIRDDLLRLGSPTADGSA